MYEMQGASLSLAAPKSAGYPAFPAPRAAAGAKHPHNQSGFPDFSRVPGVTPGVVPVSSGECISTTSATVAQESAAIHFEFSRHPHGVHRTPRVIRMWPWLSTAYAQAVHRLPWVARRTRPSQ
jgi:hypothetical protein